MDHRQKALDGSSRFYNRKCYGHTHNKQGERIPHPDQAAVVQQILDWYLEIESVIGIFKILKDQQISSPRGKDTWPKRTIDMMLIMKSIWGCYPID